MKTSRLGLLLIVTLVLWSSSALASVSGSCANCHTMHATDGAGNTLAGGAKGSLTIGGCVGCHTGDNEAADGASAGAGGVPYVMDTACTNVRSGILRWFAGCQHQHTGRRKLLVGW